MRENKERSGEFKKEINVEGKNERMRKNKKERMNDKWK